MATIQQIKRITDLPEFSKIYPGMKTVVAYNRQNFIIDLTKISGKTITDIYSQESNESGGRNVIYIKFSDGSVKTIYYFNGSEGEKGKKGYPGKKGKQGEDAYIDLNRTGITDKLEIVNNNTTFNPNLPWSAYRGKDMNEKIYDLNETFITDDEFSRLFEDIKYIYAEFKTSTDDETIGIFNSDDNAHVEYIKYWTYESSSTQTYYIFNPASGEYEPVLADLWKDIYLGSTEGYFEATTSMETDGTELYYFDLKTNTYKPITLLENPTTHRYIGDKELDYYVPILDTELHAKYTKNTNSWFFEVKTNPENKLRPEVYKVNDEDNTLYELVEDFDTINTDNIYYFLNEEGDFEMISDISAYIREKNIKMFYKDSTGKFIETWIDFDRLYTYNGKTYNTVSDLQNISELITYYHIIDGKYVQIPDIYEYIWDILDSGIYEHFNKENGDEFILSSYNQLSKVYRFRRSHNVEEFFETVYYTDNFSIKDIDMYYYDSNRRYYSPRVEYTEDEEGNRTYTTVYELVEIPSWIYAEFTTTEEDEYSILINSIKDLGEDDTTIIDETEEDTTSESEYTQVRFIVPGDKKDLYHKNEDDTYTLVDLNKDTIYSSARYYTISDEYNYVPISGEQILNEGIVEFYELTDEGKYQIMYSSANAANTYYLRKLKYDLVEDPITYLNTYDITLFINEPAVLPITMYPTTYGKKKAIIDYDPSLLRFYEDGRICATIEDTFETQIIISSDDENSNVKAYVNVTLVTPVKGITITGGQKFEAFVGETSNIRYTINPTTSTNKNIIWTSSDDSIVSVNSSDDGIIELVSLSKGVVTIHGEAEDGFGASVSFSFESVIGAESLSWNQEDVYFVDDILYTRDDVNAWTDAHRQEIIDGTIRPEDIPIQGVTVKIPAHYEITSLLGKEYRLTPIISPSDTSYKDLVWLSDDESIAKVNTREITVIDKERITHISNQNDVDNNIVNEIGIEIVDQEEESHREKAYYLVGTSLGETKVTGAFDKQRDITIELTVKVNEAVQRVDVTPTTLSMNIGTSKKLTYSTYPIENVCSWVSLDPSIVSVTPSGTVTALSGGVTQVRAIASDGSDVYGICSITSTIPTRSIQLSGDSNNGIIYVGINRTTRISAEILYDSTHNTGPKLGIDWSSSDEEVATISENGVVTGHKLGNTTIIATAKDGTGVFGTIRVDVIKLATSINFNIDEVMMDVNDTLVLTPVFLPLDTSNEIVIWSSSDEEVAMVKTSGIVYARKSGECDITITTTDGTNLSATCHITVQ